MRRHCLCGKFMCMDYADHENQEWSCKCGRKDIIDTRPPRLEYDWDLLIDRKRDDDRELL
jgi:hypothetical protein